MASESTTTVPTSRPPTTTATTIATLTSIPYCPTKPVDVYWTPGDPVPEFPTRDELDAAHDRLIERHEASGDVYLDGISPYGNNVVNHRVVIYLQDASQAPTYAEQIGLEPPFEIYCVTPTDSVSENAESE